MASSTTALRAPPTTRGTAARSTLPPFVIRVADGKVAGLSFRSDAGKLARKNGEIMAQAMARVGDYLAEMRGQPLAKLPRIDVLTGPPGKTFIEAVLQKWPADFQHSENKPLWCHPLFGNHPLPYTYECDTVYFHPNHKNAPAEIRVESAGAVISSDTARPGAFRAALPLRSDETYARRLGEEVVRWAENMRKHLEKSRPVHEAFQHAASLIRKVDTTPEEWVDVHLMSLIPPSRFYRSGEWSSHHDQIQLLTNPRKKNPWRRHQRLHVIDEATWTKAVEALVLVDVVLADLDKGLDSRALIVDPARITSNLGLPSIGGVLLLDHGIFWNSSGSYSAIISNITPFDESPPGSFSLFDISSDAQPVYHFLRCNFERAWNTAPVGKCMLLPQILDHVLKFPADADLQSLPPLKYFEKCSKGSPEPLKAIQAEITWMLNDSGLGMHGHRHPRDELKFAQWFVNEENRRIMAERKKGGRK